MFLSELVNGIEVAALIDQLRRANLRCPDCNGQAIYRHGIVSGLQRYRCRSCARTFNGLTGTPLARLRLKQRWLHYFDCMRDPSCTVDSAAATTGVHRNTSFRWRHRFLRWARLDRSRALTGIVESDTIRLLESQKGEKHLSRTARTRGSPPGHGAPGQMVNIVVARDRSGQTIDLVGGRGALKAKTLHLHLLPKLAPDVLLVTSNNGAFRRFAREANIAHAPTEGDRGVQGHVSVTSLVRNTTRTGGRSTRREAIRSATHLHNVTDYQSRFSIWLRHFNGVATRYLENYLGWHWAIDRRRIGDAAGFLRAALGFSTIKGDSAPRIENSRKSGVNTTFISTVSLCSPAYRSRATTDVQR